MCGSLVVSSVVPVIYSDAVPDDMLTTAFDVVSGVGSHPVGAWATRDVILAPVYRTDEVPPRTTKHVVLTFATTYGVVATEAMDDIVSRSTY